MSIPAVQIARIGAYIMKQRLTGKKRFPLVLMLEPLFQCNLRCKGCGKVDQPAEMLNKRLSVDECVAAAEECGAPVVSIPGGEPLLHKDIHLIVQELTKRKKFVYLCTNALLVDKRIDDFEPSPYLTFNVHLDGYGPRHDMMVCQEGVFNGAVGSIRKLLSRGFRVTTNSTFFDDETPEGMAKLFDYLTALGVEGMTISPGFNYEKAADQNSFLEREKTVKLFQAAFALGKGHGWVFNHSSLYLDFLAGNQNYECSPWGNPTYSLHGWQRPCYLLEDGFVSSFKELMEETDWDKYGVGKDPRCSKCMVHCGFEPSAVIDAAAHPLKTFKVSQEWKKAF